MTKELLKQWFLEKKHKVYSIVTETYAKEYSSLGPKRFRDWLATELDLDVEQISYNGLVQVRYRKKKKSSKKPSPAPMRVSSAATTEENITGERTSKLAVFGNVNLEKQTLDESTGIDMNELEESGFLKKKKK